MAIGEREDMRIVAQLMFLDTEAALEGIVSHKIGDYDD